MPRLPDDLYRRWLAAAFPTPALLDGFLPPERWLQQIWRHQRLRRDALRTLDGVPVRILHPGFWNRSAGPDFQGAILRFGDEPARQGDVEIDLIPAGWRGHRHAGNPAYARVILHVLWEAQTDGTGHPALVLKEQLDAPLAELAPWLQTEAARKLPESVPGRCAGPLRDLDRDTLEELVQQAALARLAHKAAELAARARQSNWNQALWEGLLGGLGYRHNVWPMRRVAELTGPGDPSPPRDLRDAQARLLGLAGLLPGELPGANARTVRELWDCWWRERDRFHPDILPREAWRWTGCRPANHPQRRLALAAHWWLAGAPGAGLEPWLAAGGTGSEGAEGLLNLLAPCADEFWSRHWTLRSPELAVDQPLLGRPRLTDLAVNVILPWLQARAEAAGDRAQRQLVQDRYLAWPAGEENAVLRLTRQRLLGAARRRLPRTAAMQQGLLALTQDFCAHSDALCSGCRLPDLVTELPPTQEASQSARPANDPPEQRPPSGGRRSRPRSEAEATAKTNG